MLHILAEASTSALSSPNFTKAMAIALGTMMPALSLGLIGSSVMKSIGRNPEAASKIQTPMVLAIAFAEAIAIYVLVVALVVKFV